MEKHKNIDVPILAILAHKQADASATPDLSKASGRKVAFDYLRAFAVTLVLCHHAILAYAACASINVENPIATATPVVNGQHWLGFDLIVAFNETYLMPLLFFISGLFVWPSLTRKGARKYLKARLIRLGLPFVIGVFFLIPIAYYPAQLQVGLVTGVDASFGEFWLGMIRSGFGTAGHLWFLWLLLAFNCLAALLYRGAPQPGDLKKGRSAMIFGHPAVFLGALLGISSAAYLPVAILFGPLKWFGIGPFHAQVSRILLYLVYFFSGTAAGAAGLDRRMFGPHGVLARRWWWGVAVGLISFILFILMIVVVTDKDRTIVSETAFVVACGAIVFGMTGFFLRFANRRIGLLDSLSENAYGIYIVHYGFVTWLQYSLLGSPLAPGVKGIAVFAGTLILSFGATAALRRIPAAARVL